MSLSVKLFVKKYESDEFEVRRFSIDYDVAASYDYMLAKISTYIPVARDNSIKLYWKDEDNELISLSSDDELMDALTNVTDGVLRLYVELPQRSKTHSTPQRNPAPGLFDLLGLLTAAMKAGMPDGQCRDGTADCGHQHEGRVDELRQKIVNTANLFLEPIGFHLTDQRQTTTNTAAAAATGDEDEAMTSSSHDQDDEQAKPKEDGSTDNSGLGNSAQSTEPGCQNFELLQGGLCELLATLGVDSTAMFCLSQLMQQQASQLAQTFPDFNATGVRNSSTNSTQ